MPQVTPAALAATYSGIACLVVYIFLLRWMNREGKKLLKEMEQAEDPISGPWGEDIIN